jgi:hypothetical protein
MPKYDVGDIVKVDYRDEGGRHIWYLLITKVTRAEYFYQYLNQPRASYSDFESLDSYPYVTLHA